MLTFIWILLGIISFFTVIEYMTIDDGKTNELGWDNSDTHNLDR